MTQKYIVWHFLPPEAGENVRKIAMFKTVKALVLREVKYKEADKILTVLTESEGKLTVKARGALRKSCKFGAAAQMLCYSEMTLFENRGKWNVNEAETIEQFLPLRGDIEALALGSYFAEALETVSDEDSPGGALLRLGLNSLYALSTGKWPQEHVKAVFELRLMCLSGFLPDLDGEGELFSLNGGRLHRRGEAPGAAGVSLPLGAAAKDAMRYIAAAEPKRIFSFSLPPEDEKQLCDLCEAYMAAQLERGFSTLEYWKRLRLG